LFAQEVSAYFALVLHGQFDLLLTLGGVANHEQGLIACLVFDIRYIAKPPPDLPLKGEE